MIPPKDIALLVDRPPSSSRSVLSAWPQSIVATTAFATIAIDAATCEMRWEYDYKTQGQQLPNPTNKGGSSQAASSAAPPTAI
jgi:hypothetical protein